MTFVRNYLYSLTTLYLPVISVLVALHFNPLIAFANLISTFLFTFLSVTFMSVTRYDKNMMAVKRTIAESFANEEKRPFHTKINILYSIEIIVFYFLWITGNWRFAIILKKIAEIDAQSSDFINGTLYRKSLIRNISLLADWNSAAFSRMCIHINEFGKFVPKLLTRSSDLRALADCNDLINTFRMDGTRKCVIILQKSWHITQVYGIFIMLCILQKMHYPLLKKISQNRKRFK